MDKQTGHQARRFAVPQANQEDNSESMNQEEETLARRIDLQVDSHDDIDEIDSCPLYRNSLKEIMNQNFTQPYKETHKERGREKR